MIEEHGATIENGHYAADCFNEYFESIGKKINSSIEKIINKVNINPANNPISIYLSDCTYPEAFNLLQNINVNKATGLDIFPAKDLKLRANILEYPVSY